MPTLEQAVLPPADALVDRPLEVLQRSVVRPVIALLSQGGARCGDCQRASATNRRPELRCSTAKRATERQCS